jgi:mgtE-like transporter
VASLAAQFLNIPYNVIDLSLISFLAGGISSVLMVLPTVFTAFATYRRGWNPDNFESPLITLCGDILTLPFLFFSAEIVLPLDHGVKTVLFIVFIVVAIFFMVLGLAVTPYARKILTDSVPVFLFCGILGVLSGGILSTRIEHLIQTAGILILVPAFLEDGGALGGILSANFSSWLHLGTLDAKILPSKKAAEKFLTMHIVGIVPFSLLGIFVYGLNLLLALPTPSVTELFLITLCAGEFLILMVNFLTFFLSVTTYKTRADPDNVVIPLVTSFMDILGSFSLIFFLILFGII